MTDKADEHGDFEARFDDLGSDPGQVGPDSAGRSGDAQGIPGISEAAPESVEDLVVNDQSFEAGVIDGVEEAGDRPEHPVRTHEDPRPRHESELPPDPDWK